MIACGSGTLTPGRFVKHRGVPMSNLLLSMGAQGVERLGDSTGGVKTV